MPVAFAAPGGPCGKSHAAPPLPQLFEPTFAGFPLLPSVTSQAAMDPIFQVSQHRRRLAEAVVASPADQIRSSQRLVVLPAHNANRDQPIDSRVDGPKARKAYPDEGVFVDEAFGSLLICWYSPRWSILTVMGFLFVQLRIWR